MGYAEASPPDPHPHPHSTGLTFPWATSSRWAAEAAFTRALVAAAMDLAASRICSSKFKLSSACCGASRGQKTKSAPGGGLLSCGLP